MLRACVLVLLVVLGGLASARADEPLQIGPFAERMVWPLTGTTTPDVIVYTFGPRRLKSDQRYDFCRGLDLVADEGTAVHAVADGEVRIAGKHPSYGQPLVQLRHAKPGDDKQYYYSNYMYLSEAVVKEGDMIEAGKLIGRTGRTPNGYQRLRFELRDGGSTQGFAVHPLGALPYANGAGPKVEIHNVSPGKTHSTVELTVTVPSDELDFVRLEFEATVGAGEPYRVTYDVNEWNRAYTSKDKSADPLDSVELNGIEFVPDFFQVGADEFRLDLRFFELPPATSATAIKVSVRAVDARGKSTEVRRPK